MKRTLTIGKGKISIHDVWEVSHHLVDVKIGEELKEKINNSRQVVEDIIHEQRPVYGVTTGFGSFQSVFISAEQTKQLQTNLIRSHAVGVGPLYSREEVRASMFCRLISNCQGNSGVRLEVLEKIAELLNKNIIPAVPSQGSVGASGDLAPLSHFILVLMGEGEVLNHFGTAKTRDCFAQNRIKPISLKAKEGLALNNGTSFMTGIAALNLYKAINLVLTADIAAALSLEACEGFRAAFDLRAQRLRGHKGQTTTARNILALLKGSQLADYNLRRGTLLDSGKKDPLKKVQDAYSLRCVPQVHGGVKDALNYCLQVVETEINSVTDNPLIFPETGDIVSSGNFHGAPIAYVMDFLAIVLTDLGNISDRRSFKLLTSSLSSGLPSCLTNEGGLHSGLMIAQYTAASLCGYNQVHSHPASVGTIPTSEGQEDHVSFGSIAANKCRDVVDNLHNILVIELLCGYQGALLRKNLIGKDGQSAGSCLGKGTKIAVDEIEKAGVNFITGDRHFGQDIKKISKLVESRIMIEHISAAKIRLSI